MLVSRREVRIGQQVAEFADYVVWDNEGFNETLTISLDGVAEPLTNVTEVVWTLAPDGEDTPTAEWKLSGTEITVTAASGLITISVTKAAIAAIGNGVYQYDVVVTGWPTIAAPANIQRGEFVIADGVGA